MADEFEFDVFLSHSTKDKQIGAEWAELGSGTFHFRDPLNQDRHSICLRPHNTSTEAYLTRRSTR